MRRSVFISGGSGYLGRALIPLLIDRKHRVRVLARAGSERKVPHGAEVITADPLRASSFDTTVRAFDTFVHLVGTPKPAPWKREQFDRIDRASLLASVQAARRSAVTHFIYVSVAHPAPVMKDYIAVRMACEEAIDDARLPATVLRPWYVLGPGHHWPRLIVPFYRMLEIFPQTCEPARRLGLVTLPEMTHALAWAVEHPAESRQVLDVPAIRSHAAMFSNGG